MAALLLGLAPGFGIVLMGIDLATLPADPSDHGAWPLTAVLFIVMSPLVIVAALLVRAGRPLGSFAAGLVGSPYLIGLALLAEEHASDQPAWDRTASLAGVALAGLTYLLGLVMIPGHGVAARRVIAWPALAATVGTAVAACAAGVDASAALFLALIAACLLVRAWAAREGGRAKAVLLAGGAVVAPYAIVVCSVATAPETPAWLAVAIAVISVCAVGPLLATLVRAAGRPAVTPADGQTSADGRTSAALIAAAMATGPVVTALGPPAIAEARRIAYEEARIKGVDVGGFPEIGDGFLEVAADAVRGYGLLFALTALALGAVAWRVRTVGGTTGTQAAAILCALLYLPLLMAASTFTPFFIGDSDENVNRAVTEGPPWYVPAVRTICACSAATLMAGIVLMIPPQARLLRRTRAGR